MTSARTLEGDGRLRLFVALRLPEAVLERLVAWQGRVLADIGEVRALPRENLHVTVAFLGSRPSAELPRILAAVRTAAAAGRSPELAVDRYRETARVGMLALREREPWSAQRLAGDVMVRLEALGVYRRESRDWLPHVTVARFRERPRLEPDLPDLGPVCPSEVAVYHSLLRPAGAQYEILESTALGG